MMMADMMRGGGNKKGERVEVIQGPNGQMTVKRTIMASADDDDDDDDDKKSGGGGGPPGIPPEILAMMKMTEQMHNRGGGGGFPGFNPFGRRKPAEKIVRKDESHEDVMKRMNAIADDVADGHNQKKYEFVDQRSNRFLNIMLVAGVFLLVILVSFIMTCRAKAKGKKGDEEDSDEDVSEMAK